MNIIVTIFLCFVFFTAVFCGGTEEELEAIYKKCKPQSGVSEELAMKAKNGEFIDDPKLKAHLLCFAKSLGFMDDAGGIIKDAIKASLMANYNDAALVDEMMTKCLVEKGSPEETNFEAVKCMHAIKPMA